LLARVASSLPFGVEPVHRLVPEQSCLMAGVVDPAIVGTGKGDWTDGGAGLI